MNAAFAIVAQIVATNRPERTISLTSMMSTDGKPGLPVIAKPDVMARIPPPGPDADKDAYIERQVVVAGDRKGKLREPESTHDFF